MAGSQMMEIQMLNAFDAIVPAPLITRANRARAHQPVKHGEEDGPLYIKLKLASGKHLLFKTLAISASPNTTPCNFRTL